MKKIIIKKNSQIITDNARRADSFFSRFKGLMFVKEIEDNYALHITPCNQIHMLNMRFALDVIYLDENGRVVKVDENVQPGKICKTEKRAKSVIEMKASASSRLGIRTGDILEVTVENH
ncbi:MAG: DUF192 domain-containing protein [Clostridia bacterium]|nr:DUF192 domain-containing protein [Clostridia bacterium]